MYKGIHLVMAVFYFIIGGWIFFIDGKGWCIACGNATLLGLGVVCIVLGLIGLVTGLKAPAAAAGRQ